MEQVNPPPAHAGTGQSGVALIMVLIMLAAMAIAGVALVRIVDSANTISGNFAFRQATLNIADLGVEAAVAKLKEMKDMKDKDPMVFESPYPAKCTTECSYYPVRSDEKTMVKASGLPDKGSDGKQVHDISWAGEDKVANLPSEYHIRYVIDRQCTVAPVTDTVAECMTDTPQGGGSKKSGATVFTPASSVYYRVSIQVTGPRRTQSHVQVVLAY